MIQDCYIVKGDDTLMEKQCHYKVLQYLLQRLSVAAVQRGGRCARAGLFWGVPAHADCFINFFTCFFFC